MNRVREKRQTESVSELVRVISRDRERDRLCGDKEKIYIYIEDYNQEKIPIKINWLQKLTKKIFTLGTCSANGMKKMLRMHFLTLLHCRYWHSPVHFFIRILISWYVFIFLSLFFEMFDRSNDLSILFYRFRFSFSFITFNGDLILTDTQVIKWLLPELCLQFEN